MKNLKSIVIGKCEKLDQQWKTFPREKQRMWVIGLFAGYMLLTAIVVLTVWYHSKTKVGNNIVAGHIHNPMAEQQEPSQDSLTKKNQDYERR
ncbi:hypothetical protein [Pedobacter agri]|uniref:hypothetical protein n=1 Tax=Pedobacter agri TaxID=454586 RepID=UPI00292D5C03|nr:hypothetical protein [Pedobacter agri]